jgi:hypothetical protein
MTTTKKCERPGCNCQSARQEKESGDTLRMQAPGVQRHRPQDVAGATPDATLSPEILRQVQPNSKVKGKSRYGTFCKIRSNSCSTCIG